MYFGRLIFSLFSIRGILSIPVDDITEDSAFKYLEQFGNTADDSDDDFQNQGGPRVTLKQYLENFQSFFGLPVTGALDLRTRELMKKPRCGVTDDIKNLHIRTTRNLRVRKWNRNRLTYRVVRYGDPQKITHTSVDRIVEKALKLWEDAADIKFSHQSAGQADIEIAFATWEHGRDLYGSKGANCDPKFDGPGAEETVLAHAFIPKPNRSPRSRCPESIDGDVHVDDDEDWSDVYNEGLDLLHTMTHELGHSLGLYHSRGFQESKESPIMQAYHPGWIEPSKFKLHEDDIRRIQELYGPPKTSGLVKPPTTPLPDIEPPTTPTPEESTPDPPASAKCVCDPFTRFDPKRKRDVGNCQTKHKGKTWCYIQKASDCSDRKTSSAVDDYNWSFEACSNSESTSNQPPPDNPDPEPPTTSSPDTTSSSKPTPSSGNGNCQCDDFTRFDERRGRDVGNCLTKFQGETWCYILKTTDCPDTKTSKTVDSHNWSRVACHEEGSAMDLTRTSGTCVCDPFTRFDEQHQKVAGNCQTFYEGQAWCYVQKTADCGDSRTSSTVYQFNWSREACFF